MKAPIASALSAFRSLIEDGRKSLIRRLFRKTSIIRIGGTRERATVDVFSGPAYIRDRTIDDAFGPSCPPAFMRDVEGAAATESFTLEEAALAIAGLDEPDPVGALSAQHRMMSLAQAESLLERTDRGESLGLLVDGGSNLILVEMEDGSAAVVCANKAASLERWSINLYWPRSEDYMPKGAMIFYCV